MIARDTMSSGPRTGRGTMTANRFRINLGKDAVKLALDGEWARAAELNRAILELYADDCEAANRLAKALMELGDYAGARSALDGLLAKHPNNNIARKNLARLETLETAGAPRPAPSAHVAGLSPLFIEEGGKSCTTTLRRTGDSCALADVVAGDTVALAMSGDLLAVNSADGRRLGTLEPKLSRRLRKLMAGGNQYGAAVVSINANTVSVVIRETRQHPSLRNVVSFPPPRRDAGVPDQPNPESVGDEAGESAEALDESIRGGAESESEAEPEDVLPALGADDIDEDDADDPGVGVPVLDADDVEDDPIREIVPPQNEDDWE